MGALYAYRDQEPVLAAGTVLFDSAEITDDVVVGENTLIGAGVKLISASHGPGPHRLARPNPGERRPAPAARP